MRKHEYMYIYIYTCIHTYIHIYIYMYIDIGFISLETDIVTMSIIIAVLELRGLG